MFGKKGLITVATSTTNEDDLLELALGAGADDMQTTGEVFEITCDPSAFEPLKKALEAKSIPIEVAEISMVPQNTVGIDSETVAKRIVSLMEAFDDHDDVQNAYANFDIPDEVMAKVS
jgi:transcriptional/translational regulatory protein YebC/TACO1